MPGAIWINSFEKCSEKDSFLVKNENKIVCCIRDIDNVELAVGVYLQEIKLTPHHWVAIIVVALLFSALTYELLLYLGFRNRNDSLAELLCSPAQGSTSFAEFFCFCCFATDKRLADRKKYDDEAGQELASDVEKLNYSDGEDETIPLNP